MGSHPQPNRASPSQEFQMGREEKPSLWVNLLWPDDKDLFIEIDAGRLKVARAIERVALRRQLEREMAEIERQERDENAWREHSE
jgi:hypothetical protein